MYVHIPLNAERIYREEMLGRALIREGIELQKTKLYPEALDTYDSFIRGRKSLPPLEQAPETSCAKGTATLLLPFFEEIERAVSIIARNERERRIRRSIVASLLREYGTATQFVYDLTLCDSIIPFESRQADLQQELAVVVLSPYIGCRLDLQH